MDEGPDAETVEPVLPAEAPARLDLERLAASLGEDPGDVSEAFAQAGVDPETVAGSLTGARPAEAVRALAEALDRPEPAVAVSLADALQVEEDVVLDLVDALEIDPGVFAEEIRRAHLQGLLQDLDVASWLPWSAEEEPPTLENVVARARRAEKQVVSGGLFVAAFLIAFGLVMFRAPPLLRQVIWVLLGVLLVAAGVGLILALVRLADITDRYLARIESVADEFEGEDSIAVVAEVAQQSSVGRRAQEAALRRAWRLFRQARARRASEGEEADEGDADAEAEDGDGPEEGEGGEAGAAEPDEPDDGEPPEGEEAGAGEDEAEDGG